MFEGGTVLVATDLSEPAAVAVTEAARWASLTRGRLVAVLVASNPLRGNPLFPSWEQHAQARLRALAQRATEELQRQLAAAAPGTSVDIVVEQGDPPTVLAAEARARHAALLVVGSHGYTGLKRALLGSVAEKVVRRAECPVLVARPAASGAVLIGTDFSEPSQAAVKWGLEAARLLGQRPVLAHVLDYGPLPSVAWSNSFPEPMAAGFGSATYLPPPEIREEARREAEQRLRSELFAAGVDGEVAIEEGPSGPTLATLAGKHRAGLVVVGTAGRTGLARLALGSVAESAVRNCPCSVLVVRGA